MSNERKFYSLLHQLRSNYTTGKHTYGSCSNHCGNRARGSGLCSDCCEKEIAGLVGNELARNIHEHTRLAWCAICEALGVMEAMKVANKEREPQCNCSMRIKMVGDGCSVCNPEYWQEMLDEQAQEKGDE